jgi:hypothetical protein
VNSSSGSPYSPWRSSSFSAIRREVTSDPI